MEPKYVALGVLAAVVIAYLAFRIWKEAER